MVPVWMQTPPTIFGRSTIATRRPILAAAIAPFWPGGRAPNRGGGEARGCGGVGGGGLGRRRGETGPGWRFSPRTAILRGFGRRGYTVCSRREVCASTYMGEATTPGPVDTVNRAK